MIIVLTTEHETKKELQWINPILESGIDFLHIRKYNMTRKDMENFLNAIDSVHRDKLVLHSHFKYAEDWGIKRLHIREADRLAKNQEEFYADYALSTSVHRISDFNTLNPIWAYAFLSPVFPSISKPTYGTETTIKKELNMKNNSHVRLIGLGGIKPENLITTKEAGADGIALLGAVWQNENPLQVITSCIEKDQLY